MDDLKPFRHGEESTHSACPEMVQKLGGKVGCCSCNGHACKQAAPEGKSFFDFSPEEKKDIIETATCESNRKQKKVMEEPEQPPLGDWRKELAYIMSKNGSSNYAKNIQYSDSKYPNRFTEEVLIEFFQSELSKEHDRWITTVQLLVQYIGQEHRKEIDAIKQEYANNKD